MSAPLPASQSLPPVAPSVAAEAYVRVGGGGVGVGGGPPIDLWLDGNEGPALDPALVQSAAASLADGEAWRRYPIDSDLCAQLAARFGIEANRVVLGAGADELLDRMCRAWLAPGRSLTAPLPCFAMLPRYVRAAGAELRGVSWTDGSAPIEELLRTAQGSAVLALTTPNNPTGGVIAGEDIVRLARSLPNVLVLVDLAYAEFADRDPTAELLTLANVVVVRTFSKARGLAGLRVGYAMGSAEAIAVLRAVGSPYPCSSLSLRICATALAEDDPQARIAQVRREREQLRLELRKLGLEPLPSQANFVFARAASSAAAQELRRALAAQGIAIRTFAATAGPPSDDALKDLQLANAVRITCPGDAPSYDRLARALRQGDAK
ncbi:MAG: histidinol-phosphate transaminase [Planctomycetota bacterium]